MEVLVLITLNTMYFQLIERKNLQKRCKSAKLRSVGEGRGLGRSA